MCRSRRELPTSIYLQKSASIQPRTSPSKFGGKLFNTIHSCPYLRHIRQRSRFPKHRQSAPAQLLEASASFRMFTNCLARCGSCSPMFANKYALVTRCYAKQYEVVLRCMSPFSVCTEDFFQLKMLRISSH